MQALWKDCTKKYPMRKTIRVAEGGESRADSVWSGLQHVSGQSKFVLVHDAARPLISLDLVLRVMEACRGGSPAIPGVKIKSTLKEVNSDGWVGGTPDREKLFEAQTPQGARVEDIKSAYLKAGAKSKGATDESFLLEKAGIPVKMVMGEESNIKVTTSGDIQWAEFILVKKNNEKKSGY